MVVFNCNACGEALKKNQVEKHYQLKCRRCEVLSCVDCGKEFWGNDYEQHVKCISEEEKYSGKNFKQKPNANKGEQKQELWTQQVQAAVAKVSANARLKNVLQQLIDFPNIPRKKAKFENFLKNSFRIYDGKLASDAWDAISAELNKQSTVSTESSAETVQSDSKSVAQSKNDEQRCDDNNEQSTTDNGNDNDKSKKKGTQQLPGCDDNTDAGSCDASNGESLSGKKRDHEKKKKDKKTKKQGDSNGDAEDGGKRENGKEVSDGRKHSNNNKKKRKRDESVTVSENGHGLSADKYSKTEQKQSKKKKKKTSEDHSNGTEEEKNAESGDENENSGVDGVAGKPAGSFKWEAAIVGVLKRATDNQLKLNKLRKKVMSEFNERGGDGKMYSAEKLQAKLTRKLETCQRIKLTKDCARLVH